MVRKAENRRVTLHCPQSSQKDTARHVGKVNERKLLMERKCELWLENKGEEEKIKPGKRVERRKEYIR